MAKILVVDDETIFIKIAQKSLEASGYEVITANDGLEGLMKAENEHPDLILLDILMPKMDGYNMLKEVRKNEKIKNTPVILCSANDQQNDKKDDLNNGADAYMAKPIESVILLSKIEELLKK